ncbi:MAG: glycosyltransferase family 2 protein [Erysipelotrichaceae bacterium]|nr:glycosyltransferase family 2 protein [Erysipelotrichaceae bacterium]
MNNAEPLITIITPTYNRADCLKKCWESLCRQSFSGFQWLVIDDGSADNTEEVVKGFIADSQFEIDYYKKKNGGKHTALNFSHPYIKGQYMAILDSDDTLTPNGLERLKDTWERYSSNKEVGQVIFLKGYREDRPICYVAHPDTVVDSIKEPRISVSGRDCFDSYRTELFVKHSFPEFEGEKFIGEGSAFFFIELESKAVYVNEVIYLCDYRDDGLTKAGRSMRMDNPLGGMYNSRVYMNSRLPLSTRLKKGVLYACYSKIAGKSFGETMNDNEYKLLTAITYLPGVLLSGYWKKKYSGGN